MWNIFWDRFEYNIKAGPVPRLEESLLLPIPAQIFHDYAAPRLENQVFFCFEEWFKHSLVNSNLYFLIRIYLYIQGAVSTSVAYWRFTPGHRFSFHNNLKLILFLSFLFQVLREKQASNVVLEEWQDYHQVLPTFKPYNYLLVFEEYLQKSTLHLWSQTKFGILFIGFKSRCYGIEPPFEVHVDIFKVKSSPNHWLQILRIKKYSMPVKLMILTKISSTIWWLSKVLFI